MSHPNLIPEPTQDPNPTPENLPGPTSSSDEETLKILRESALDAARTARQEQNRRIELEQEVENLRRARENPAPTQVTPEQFWNDPLTTLRAEISTQIAPLLETAKKLNQQTVYQNLKQQFLADAQYGPIVNKLGQHLDNLMQSLEPTIPNMRNAIHSLLGQIAITNPELLLPAKKEETPNPTPSPSPSMVTPPHLRPSSSPLPSSEDNKPKKQYTENERRLMRELKMTEEQWENSMNAPANLSTLRKK